MTDMKEKRHRKATGMKARGRAKKGPDFNAREYRGITRMAWKLLRDRKNPGNADDSQGTHEALVQDLEKSRQKGQEYFDGWQRERADFVNYKKRLERDQEQHNNNFTLNFIKKYLVILDDLDRALKARLPRRRAAWSAGVELIYRKLQNYLEMEGYDLFQPIKKPLILPCMKPFRMKPARSCQRRNH